MVVSDVTKQNQIHLSFLKTVNDSSTNAKFSAFHKPLHGYIDKAIKLQILKKHVQLQVIKIIPTLDIGTSCHQHVIEPKSNKRIDNEGTDVFSFDQVIHDVANMCLCGKPESFIFSFDGADVSHRRQITCCFRHFLRCSSSCRR